ncbi:MAG: M14-type cytosolic carboxypeptidase [Tunicatimonas sp.]
MKLPYAVPFLLSPLLLSPLLNPAFSQSTPRTPISISTDFEGGNLGGIRQIDETHWECALAGESDADDRNRQASWYYFRIDGAKGTPLTIELTDLVGEYNYKYGSHPVTSETRPVISHDQTHWHHLSDQQVQWNAADTTLRLTFNPERDTVWVAHIPPYTTEPLAQLLTKYQGYPSVVLRPIGYTPQGRPLQLMTLTNPQVALDQKKVVWLMARQHSWEAGTSYVVDAALRYLLDAAPGQALLDSIVFQIIPMGDPDGVARGGVRFNAFGHDLNRNWDHVVAEEMPEIAAQKRTITTWLADGHPIDLFLTLHNTESADYLQGPDRPVGQRLWQDMVETSSFESEEGLRAMAVSTTPGKPGRMTVNQALWAEEQVPAYLMELKVERVGKLNGRRTVDDWRALGPKLVQAIAAAVK